MTNAPRAGTSICESRLLASWQASVTSTLEASAAPIRNKLDGMCVNTIVRFDPKTQKFQSWTIPGGGNIVRNTDVTPDNNWVLANSLTNEVTLVTLPK